MTVNKQLHAKHRPPSAAARWLSCPGSVTVVPMYDRDESDHSLKGDKAHKLLEDGIVFGIKPDSDDPDIDLNIMGVLEHIAQTRAKYGDKCQLFAELQYDIPETGEFGTCDVTFVTPRLLHIADYKNGYVVVDVRMNAQMMTYLLGAIAKFGERDKYIIEIYQPNYHHVDGPYRQYEVTQSDIDWFRNEVKWAMQSTEFVAGKHCKKTYCEHRGTCATFHAWAKENLADAYFPSEVNGLSDAELAQALDHAEILQGLRDELRKEAMRRMLQQDKQIDGWKLARSRTDRSFTEIEPVKELALALGATEDDLYQKTFESVAGIERFVKQKFKHFGSGKWKEAWDNSFKAYIRDQSSSLTVVRAIDGRPAHTRGSEFGSIVPAQDGQKVTLVI